MTRDATETRRRGPQRAVVVLVAAAAMVLAGGCNIFGFFGDDSGESQWAKKKGGGAGGGGDAGASGGEGETPSESAGPSGDVGGGGGPRLAAGSEDAGGGPRRNPFAPQIEVDEEEDEEEVQKSKTKLGPLEKHALEEYRLVGIISEVAVPKAMFIAPSGKGHLLKEADRLGREGGVIKDIRNNTVVIEVPQKGEGTGAKTIELELREREISTQDDSELSPRERETLQQLMESEEGRKAVRESFEKAAPAANTAEEEGNTGPRRRRKKGTSGSGEEAPPAREAPE